MNLIEILIALKNSKPGTQSEYLHSEFKRNLDTTTFNVDRLHELIDEAKLKSELGLDIIGVLCECINTVKPDYSREVDALIRANQYIAAIKLYRTNTGLSLSESKKYVDMRKVMQNVH